MSETNGAPDAPGGGSESLETLDQVLGIEDDVRKAYEELAGADDADGADGATDRERDERGRFASRDKPAEGEGATPPEAEIDTAAVAEAAVERPDGWTDENWTKLTPEAREAVAQREVEVKEHTQESAWLRRTIGDFADRFEKTGIHPMQGIRELLEMERALSTDPARAIHEIARAIRFDLRTLFNSTDAQGQPAQPDPQQFRDPRLDHFLAEQQRERDAQERRATTAAMQENTKLIDTFRKAPGHEHFETVRNDMAVIVQARPELGSDLEKVYRIACAAHPKVGAAILAAERKAAVDKAETERTKRRAASVSVRDNPGSGARMNGHAGGSTLEAAQAAWEELAAR